ncbi:MAG TPA: DUF4231 domain-containing protein [Ktedonobacterales bacterium]
MSGASNVTGSAGGASDHIPTGAAGSPQPEPSAQLTLAESDMPGLYTAANQASMVAQRTFFRWLAVELVSLSLAALVAVFAIYNLGVFSVGPFSISGLPAPISSVVASAHNITIVGLVSGLFSLVALAARLIRHWRRYDRVWYESRAAAESVKSLAWRYATGGRPFPLGGDETAPRILFFQRLEDTLIDVARDLKNTVYTDAQKITPAMDALRKASIKERQGAYSVGRIQDQENWYTKKAKGAQASATAWHRWLVAIETVGVASSIALAFRLIPFNLQGLIAAVAGGVISWTQTKRFQDLEASYEITASELGSIKQKIGAQANEDAWATFVDESEEACSREHRLWRATHDGDDSKQ